MKKWILLIILIIITTIYLYCYSLFSLDAIWNYGFANNIANGLIPYKDYNMIITPLFPYILSLFIIIFGNKFIWYYLLISIIIVLISYFSYKRIGKRAIFIYFLAIITSNIGYNVLALLLLIFLINQIDTDNDDNSTKIPILISLMIFTKQTLGILIIPSIIYSKKRKKTILIYIISFLLLILYLVINNNLWEFINYCFLGMFDFTSNNSSKFSGLTIIELIIVTCLLIKLLKSKFNDRKIFYILLFQIICFPIVDGVHFLITSIPVIYYILDIYNHKYINYFICFSILSFFITYNYTQLDYSLDYIYKNKSSFMYGRRTPNYFPDYFNYIKHYIKEYDGYKIYILESRAYLAKLELNMKINKYDLINNGNMGYKGSQNYIKEIDNYCKKHKCLFFVDYSYQRGKNQINDDIIVYINKKYHPIISSNLDNVYIN